MKEIIRKAKAVKSSKVIGPIITGSESDNLFKVPKALWSKLSKESRIKYNNLRAEFCDSFYYHPQMVKDPNFDAYRETVAHNFALIVVWDEARGKKCRHSFVKAQGIKGGYVFNYCNKCGITEPIGRAKGV